MGLEINRTFSAGVIQPNIIINRNSDRTNFLNALQQDTFERQGTDKYTTETAIKKMIASNPQIKSMMKDVNASLNLNIDELNNLLNNHAKETQNICIGITENLPFALKNKVNIKSLKDAAYLHDIGKVLIPKDILNKPGKLDNKETEIMHRHSELGYELLKTTDIDNQTLNLVRNHHQNAKKTGYPLVKKDFFADLNLQILTAADKYSALTEKRTYKEALSPKEALTIIYRDVKEEKLHPFVFKALVTYINNIRPANNLDNQVKI